MKRVLWIIFILVLATPCFATGDPIHPKTATDISMSILMCAGMFGWAVGALYYACRKD